MAILQGVDYRVCDLLAHSGATLTAADAPLLLYPGGVNVVGTVDDNRALSGQIIDAGFQAVHPQRVAEAPHIAFAGAKQAEARLVTARDVRKLRCHILP